MGISTHVYAILGVKIPWDDEFNDAHEQVYDDSDLPDMIFDGMGGEYTVLGKSCSTVETFAGALKRATSGKPLILLNSRRLSGLIEMRSLASFLSSHTC